MFDFLLITDLMHLKMKASINVGQNIYSNKDAMHFCKFQDTKFYDKVDDSDFPIVNFPFLEAILNISETINLNHTPFYSRYM